MQLGMALKLMGDAPRSQQALDLALKTPRNDSKNWMADYGSQLRDNALMLSLLEEYKLLPDAQNTLLNALSEQAFSQRWLSTQESNALFWPDVRCKLCQVHGRRKPRCLIPPQAVIHRWYKTSTATSLVRCR